MTEEQDKKFQEYQDKKKAEELENVQPYILSLDDDDSFNMLLEKKATKNGITIKTTSTVAEFIGELKISSPNLILLDLNLEESAGAGFQVIKAIRNKRGDDIPILALTRRSKQEDVDYAMKLGANDFVSKPLDIDLLITKINKHSEVKVKTEIDFSFKRIMPQFGGCKLEFDFKIKEINEFGLILISPHFISKGALITLTCPLFHEISYYTDTITVTVNSVSTDEDSGMYQTVCAFDTTDGRFNSKLIMWLNI